MVNFQGDLGAGGRWLYSVSRGVKHIAGQNHQMMEVSCFLCSAL